MSRRILGDSPVTKALVDVRAIFVGGTASLTLDFRNRGPSCQHPARAAHPGRKGLLCRDRNYNSDNQVEAAGGPRKKAGDVPLTIAASAEKGGSAMLACR